MESITWEGAERMLGTLDESQRLALFLARVRSGTVEETNIAIAAAAMGMAWVNDPPMPGARATSCRGGRRVFPSC
jgi:hypothetical protein